MLTPCLPRPGADPVATSFEPAGRPAPAAGASGTILIVDDEPVNVQVVKKYLQLAGFQKFCTCTDPTDALALIEHSGPDLLLLDIMMPQISGLEILETLRASERHTAMPILILTAVDDREVKSRALNLGATDFLPKPIDPTDLVPRVRNALLLKAHHDQVRSYAGRLEQEVAERTAELAQSRLEIIHCLARAAEYRDNETGQHVVRVGRYAEVIARGLGLAEADIELLRIAAVLHDVGKIGVPDSILLKPGKLDPDETAIMRKHCGFGKRIFEPMSSEEFAHYSAHTTVGARIIENCRAPLLELAARIALTHHERWDGAGYPLGLAGEDIPLEGRITAVADVFDALSSRRPYKPAFPLETCLSIMESARGTQFDPRVLDAFFARRAEIVAIQVAYADVV